MEIAKIKITGTSVEVSDLQTITSGMIGANVGIEYDNTWDGLNKQVVFKTALKTVNADGCTIPPELLRISGINLLAGVYGYTGDGSVAIPTVWAYLGRIQPGADPEGDEAAKPTLPVWARMQAQIDGVEESFNDLAVSTEAALVSANKAASTAAEQAGAASSQAEAASEKADALEQRLDQLENSVNTGLTELDALIGGDA